MNTTQLKCFIAVADNLSFTKAARDLYFSTPTVTHHIQQLEEEFKTKLFIRNKKSVYLTQAGKLFYPEANDILKKYYVIIERTQNNQPKSMLRIGCTSQGEAMSLHHYLSYFREKYPTIEPYIAIEPYNQLLDMFKNKQLDILFVSHNMIKDEHFPYQFHYLRKCTSYALMSIHHPLAYKESLSFEELKDKTLIRLHNKYIPYASSNTLKDLMAIHDIHYHDINCDYDQVCLILASSGYGIAIMPDYCIPEYYQQFELVRIPIQENDDDDYGIICEEDNHHPAHQFFISLMQKQVI